MVEAVDVIGCSVDVDVRTVDNRDSVIEVVKSALDDTVTSVGGSAEVVDAVRDSVKVPCGSVENIVSVDSFVHVRAVDIRDSVVDVVKSAVDGTFTCVTGSVKVVDIDTDKARDSVEVFCGSVDDIDDVDFSVTVRAVDNVVSLVNAVVKSALFATVVSLDDFHAADADIDSAEKSADIVGAAFDVVIFSIANDADDDDSVSS